jgi:hypothetical protein
MQKMNRPIRVLLQTTIPTTADDWSIARFSRLANYLREERSDDRPVFDVTTRDRDPLGAPDSVLSALDETQFDNVWLFAVDTGDGLTGEDSAGLTRYRRAGGGLMVTRDHMDLGCSVCAITGVGSAHHFHTHNVDPGALLERDDPFTAQISWPNFHSGANGDYQAIEPVGAVHPILSNPLSPSGTIRFLPSHPHEGAVSAPPGESARVIATGISQVTSRRFNIAVAFEAHDGSGRAVAQSTFHHFADYNWDVRSGAPSFVDEPPGYALARDPAAMADTQRYWRNVAVWLAGEDPASERANGFIGGGQV